MYISLGFDGAVVAILETLDVVLTQIATGLHLDDHQSLGPGVLEAVLGLFRDIGRFVF